jgi:hypothetical protein
MPATAPDVDATASTVWRSDAINGLQVNIAITKFTLVLVSNAAQRPNFAAALS